MTTPSKLIENALNASHPYEALNEIASGDDIIFCPTIGDGRLAVCRYPDGAKMAKYDNSFKANEARLYFPALLPGDLAKSPLNPVINEHI